MITKEELLDKYSLQTKTVNIKAINAEVKIKKLTIAQRQEVDELLFGDAVAEGASKGIKVEIARYKKAAKLAVSYALVEPELKPADLDRLNDNATDFINEVYAAIEEFDQPKKSKAGS